METTESASSRMLRTSLGSACVKRCIAIILLTLVLFCPEIQGQFSQRDEARYLQDFQFLIENSYSESIPDDIWTTCRSAPRLSSPMYDCPALPSPQATVADVNSICGQKNCRCVVDEDTSLSLDGNVNVDALLIKGIVNWNSETQKGQTQWLCAGFIVVEGNGELNINLTASAEKSGIVYIKNNGALHPSLGTRVLGGLHTAESRAGFPIIDIAGRELARTWSLLSRNAQTGSARISLMHDIRKMGWRVGDRIAIAPTNSLAESDAQSFRIAEIDFTDLVLAEDGRGGTSLTSMDYLGVKNRRAEVINLSRNVIVTGDDFTEEQCRDTDQPGVYCACDNSIGRSVCTVGLHTIMAGHRDHNMDPALSPVLKANGGQTGGLLKIQHTRLEKCGQRGMKGRYCLHYHMMQQCPDCVMNGNAVEFGQQRGIIVHGSHLTRVEHNVIYDVKGAGIYIEDGNEMYNTISYNVAICPNAFRGSRGGCTIPGTDNPDSDTSSNQAGIWALGNLNHMFGNRMANHFNGLFFQGGLFPFGRASSLNHICPQRLPFGRISGNVNHGNGRFGLYFLTQNYPKKVRQSMGSKGLVISGAGTEFGVPTSDWTSCSFAERDGFDNGAPVTMVDNADFGNAFVGGYEFGDIQLQGSVSQLSNNILYWKESKNMADGCSAHLLNVAFMDGNVALPDTRGTFLMDGVSFRGKITLEANHHCGAGGSGAITGFLCNPQYILLNPQWDVASESVPGSGIFLFDVENQNNDGGVFALAPTNSQPDATGSVNSRGLVFPAGFQALAGPSRRYLLAIDGGATCQDVASVPGVSPDFSRRTRPSQQNQGILCRKPLRRLNVWSRGRNRGELRLTLIQNGAEISRQDISRWRTGQTDKQGYHMVVLLDETIIYNLELVNEGGNVPQDWVIEFSDPIMGNRFQEELIKLRVKGRECEEYTSSQHDRLWIDGNTMSGSGFGDDFDLQWGRGACSGHPDMARSSYGECEAEPLIELECPELCNGSCQNGFCDCGLRQCKCLPGFFGPDCAESACEMARCGPHGQCKTKYLGGELSPAVDACECEDGWFGPTCESNPCLGDPCAGSTCVSTGETTYRCEASCAGFCQGEAAPHGCSIDPYNDGKPRPLMCNRVGGCAWPGVNEEPLEWLEQRPAWWYREHCCYKNCGTCEYKDCPKAPNDCHVDSPCQDGICGNPEKRADGSVCHSAPWGICLDGICVPGDGFVLPPPPPTCTRQDNDPWSSGEEIPCCEGLNKCIRNWDGDGRWYYLCKQQCEIVAPTQTPTPAPTTPAPTTPAPTTPAPTTPAPTTPAPTTPAPTTPAPTTPAPTTPAPTTPAPTTPAPTTPAPTTPAPTTPAPTTPAPTTPAPTTPAPTTPTPTQAPTSLECTGQDEDPWRSGDEISCCRGLEACLKDWGGDGRWYYLCKPQYETPTPTAAPTPVPTTPAPTAPAPTALPCTGEDEDPWSSGKEVSCCTSLQKCIKDWDGDGRWYFRCQKSCSDEQVTAAPTTAPPEVCTKEGEDPWGSGLEVSCCAGFQQCLRDWDGDGRWHFRCHASCPSKRRKLLA